MKYKLINPPNKNFSTIQQILYNRGMKLEDIHHYLNLNDADINSPLLLGEQSLKQGLNLLLNVIKNNQKAIVILDCDCDGYTASALLINYLYKIFPTWVTTQLEWYIHDGKQHGLGDCINYILNKDYALVICPDAASNDYEYHKQLTNNNKKILILDHHLADHISTDAVVINNQLSDYPNKELSGVGVVWQFCRYIDSILQINQADNYLDLVALGLCADMMSLLNFETRYLISKGFQKKNIHNPFIEYIINSIIYIDNQSLYN